MTTITIPRETWDAMLEALERLLRQHNSLLADCDKLGGDAVTQAQEALSAAKAVAELASPEYDQLRAKVQPTKLQVTLVDSPVHLELAQYRRMFEAACVDLGLINEALGLDPNDGGLEQILDAIDELKAVQPTITNSESRGPQASKPAFKKLISWRTAEYLRETNDPKMAKNLEDHYEILPFFDGDANPKSLIDGWTYVPISDLTELYHSIHGNRFMGEQWEKKCIANMMPKKESK